MNLPMLLTMIFTSSLCASSYHLLDYEYSSSCSSSSNHEQKTHGTSNSLFISIANLTRGDTRQVRKPSTPNLPLQAEVKGRRPPQKNKCKLNPKALSWKHASVSWVGRSTSAEAPARAAYHHVPFSKVVKTRTFGFPNYRVFRFRVFGFRV